MGVHFKTLFATVTLVWALLIVGPGFASEGPFARRLSIVATSISDEQLETVSTVDIAIRSEAAISAFGQIILPVNEHFNEMEILEAATIKSDGRHLDVPADKILASSLPNSSQLGIFEADVRIRTIVFPDVAVGDTVHYKVHKRDLRRGIAGGFSAVYAVAPSNRFDEVRITLDAPKTLAVKESLAGFSRTSEERNERRLVSWTLGPQTYRADEPGATASIDRDPYVIFSSYPDWQTIGQTFLGGAAPMSEPTPELRLSHSHI